MTLIFKITNGMIGGNGMTLSEVNEDIVIPQITDEMFGRFSRCESCERKRMVYFYFIGGGLFFVCADCK